MLDWATSETTKVQTLIFAIVAVLAVYVIAHTFHRTKALIPTVVAAITSGVVVWAVHNVDWFSAKVQTDTGSLPAPIFPVTHAVPRHGEAYLLVLPRPDGTRPDGTRIAGVRPDGRAWS